MSGRFVRASKYRHVYGRPSKKEQCYDNLRISRNAWDSNLIKANPTYLSVNWEASGGGAFAVIPLNEKGRLPEQIPLFRGHTAPVLDTDWSPFDDSLVASGSDDGKVFLWRVPADFTVHTPDNQEVADVPPVAKLTGHSRKVGHVLFSPAAADVLATSAGDYTVKLWDVTRLAPQAKATLTLAHGDIVQSLSFSPDSALLVTTSRDKKLRIWDPRQQKPAHEVAGHAGAKNSRAVWMGERDRIATTGFSKMSDRQLGLWDVREPGKGPVGGFENLDSMSGVCMPFWDEGTRCLYLAGKGDGNIRYFEYEHDKFEFLSEYKSADPQRGIAFLPKRGVNTHENEVLRAFKTVADSYIEPISFIVPRRAEVFQSDIYPPCTGSTPGVTAADWFAGKAKMAPKIEMESLYDGEGEGAPVADAESPAPTTTSSAAAPAPPAIAKEPKPPGAKPTPAPAPPPSVNDQKQSISALASKFADDKPSTPHGEDDDDEEVEGDSGFNEPPRTLGASVVGEPRSTPVRKLGADFSASKPGATGSSASSSAPSAAKTEREKEGTLPAAGANSTQPVAAPASDTKAASSSSAPIESSLQEIHKLLKMQTEKIEALTGEVDGLRKSVRGGQDGRAGEAGSKGESEEMRERIRELEGMLERERLRGGGGEDEEA